MFCLINDITSRVGLLLSAEFRLRRRRPRVPETIVPTDAIRPMSRSGMMINIAQFHHSGRIRIPGMSHHFGACPDARIHDDLTGGLFAVIAEAAGAFELVAQIAEQ